MEALAWQFLLTVMADDIQLKLNNPFEYTRYNSIKNMPTFFYEETAFISKLENVILRLALYDCRLNKLNLSPWYSSIEVLCVWRKSYYSSKWLRQKYQHHLIITGLLNIEQVATIRFVSCGYQNNYFYYLHLYMNRCRLKMVKYNKRYLW